MEKIKKFIFMHRTISVIIALILLALIVGGIGGHRRFGGPGGCPMGGPGPQGPACPMGGERLFDKFCDGKGAMQDAPGFKKKFMMGAGKRFEKLPPMKEHLQKVIDELKKKSYDTTNLEAKLQQVDQMLAQFESGQNDIQTNPESFCANHSGWIELNTKIKSIMTGILDEIQKAEGK